MRVQAGFNLRNMRRRPRARYKHFAFVRYVPERPSKVYGAAPAIVFAPPGPIASIVREKRVNRGWEKLQAMLNGGGDHTPGYDDGEWQPQTRGIHV